MRRRALSRIRVVFTMLAMVGIVSAQIASADTDAYSECGLTGPVAEAGPLERIFLWPAGGGGIHVESPAEYHRVPALDCDDPDAFFYTYRPNILGREVPDAWDMPNMIATDRPDFTDAPYSAGRNVTVIETGFTFREIKTEEGIEVRQRRLPEMLLRRGITDELELRIKWNGYLINDVHDVPAGTRGDHFGTDDIILGFKYELVRQDGFMPMLTFVGTSTVPTGTRGFSARQVQPHVNLVYGWGLRRWLYLKGSTSVEFLRDGSIIGESPGSPFRGPTSDVEVDNITMWHQSVSMIFQLSKHFGGYVEWFSNIQGNAIDNRPAHFGNMGTYIYITPNVQFDVRVGERFSNRIDNFFTGTGFSVRY